MSSPAASSTTSSKHVRSAEALPRTPKVPASNKRIPVPSAGASSSASPVNPQRVSQDFSAKAVHRMSSAAKPVGSASSSKVNLEETLSAKSGILRKAGPPVEQKQEADRLLAARKSNGFAIGGLMMKKGRGYNDVQHVQRELETSIFLLSVAHGVSLREAKMQWMLEAFQHWFKANVSNSREDPRVAQMALFRWLYSQSVDVVQTYDDLKELIRRLNRFKGYQLPNECKQAFEIAIKCRSLLKRGMQADNYIRLLEIFIEEGVDFREARLRWAVESFDNWASRDSSTLVNDLENWSWTLNKAFRDNKWGIKDPKGESKREWVSHGPRALIRWLCIERGGSQAIQDYEDFCALIERLNMPKDEIYDEKKAFRLMHHFNSLPFLEHFNEAKSIGDLNDSWKRRAAIVEIAVIYQISLEDAAEKFDKYNLLNALDSFVDFHMHIDEKCLLAKKFFKWLLREDNAYRDSFVSIDQVEVFFAHFDAITSKQTQEQLDLAHQIIAECIQEREADRKLWGYSFSWEPKQLIDEESVKYKVLMTAVSSQISIDEARQQHAIEFSYSYMNQGHYHDSDDSPNYLNWLRYKDCTFLVRTYAEFANTIAAVNKKQYRIECPSEDEYNTVVKSIEDSLRL